MQNISLDEAFDRFDNMEVVERWNSVGECWIKIRKCPTDVKSLEWCVNEEQDYWIKYSNNFGLMHFFLKGKYRLPQQKINFKEVPWYKAIEWMKNNPNKKARLNHTNINNFDFVEIGWPENSNFILHKQDLEGTWKIPENF